jgi:hypothetical protein
MLGGSSFIFSSDLTQRLPPPHTHTHSKTGLISEAKGAELDSAVGPTPMTTGPPGDLEVLRAEALELNQNAAVRDAILADLEPVRRRKD